MFNQNTSPNFADPRGVERNAFRMYVGSLNYQEKIDYLNYLENNYGHQISSNYFETFSTFNSTELVLLPVEVVTRIHFIFSDLNPK